MNAQPSRRKARLLAALVASTLLVASCSSSDSSNDGNPDSGPDPSPTSEPSGGATSTAGSSEVAALAEVLSIDDPSPREYTECIASEVVGVITANDVARGVSEEQRTAYEAAARTCFTQVFPSLDDDPAIAAFVSGETSVRSVSVNAGSQSVEYTIELPTILVDSSGRFDAGNLFAIDAPPSGQPTFGVAVTPVSTQQDLLSNTQDWDQLVDGSDNPEGLAWGTVDGVTSVVTGADAMTNVPVGDDLWLTCRASIRGNARPMTQGYADIARELLAICSSIEPSLP